MAPYRRLRSKKDIPLEARKRDKKIQRGGRGQRDGRESAGGRVSG